MDYIGAKDVGRAIVVPNGGRPQPSRANEDGFSSSVNERPRLLETQLGGSVDDVA